MPWHRSGLGRRDPVLVPRFRPLSGAPHRGQIEEDAARRVRQAAPFRLAAAGRPGNPDFDRQAAQRRHRGRAHRRSGAGGRHHRRGTGDDRPARPDRRIDPRREGSRRSGVRLHRHGGRQDACLRGEVGRANRNRENRPDPQRHRGLYTRLAANRRTIGRQSGRPDACGRRAGARHHGPAGRRRRA